MLFDGEASFYTLFARDLRENIVHLGVDIESSL